MTHLVICGKIVSFRYCVSLGVLAKKRTSQVLTVEILHKM